MNPLRWLLEPFLGPEKAASPTQVLHRVLPSEAAIILIHGFSGNINLTWSGMLPQLLAASEIQGWDIVGLGFPSSLRIDVPNVWSADPDLTTIAKGITTTLSLQPLRNYKALAIITHSMGGLAAQRALIDDTELSTRVSHFLMFGTPSGGLPKARIGAKLKRQFRDMSPKSDFIQKLRRDWNTRFGKSTPFQFCAIAGDCDEFVPSSSSLAPFASWQQAVVPGNHLDIVKPLNAHHQSIALVRESLSGQNRLPRAIDSAKLAVELGQFKKAIQTLEPQIGQLDDNAVVSLALALESTGRGDDALEILENFHRGGTSSTEAKGTLAGRLKRRWLSSRNATDYERSLQLYEAGLAGALQQRDYDQAYYHAINVAFLQLMKIPAASAINSSCQDMAKQALEYCKLCAKSQWRLATEGEAFLILENLSDSHDRYREAIQLVRSPREIDSMYAQAFRISERIFGESGVKRIEETFGLKQ